MALIPPSDEEAPHLAALRRAVELGFRFRPLTVTPEDGGVPAALYAERWCRYGVVENITVPSMDQTIARRLRTEDYPHGDPLWQHIGTVADVIHELLALPAHGFPGAPTLARRTSDSFWLPGNP
ncbi:hypothetical protein GCM10009676_33710 [Prauserella halophila]|uniref:Zeta toxin n=1 Tax=Prauserella halophila TaxID=185641 RepID=A0ABP4GZH5_9PSEU|nr:hypothetical protein [Prauserella halophila]